MFKDPTLYIHKYVWKAKLSKVLRQVKVKFQNAI